MIRRSLPLGDEPREWLLISQVEHARISHQMASHWKGLFPSELDAVRTELLGAILHHDDGWSEWEASPVIDPKHGRPYGFTEMPPADGQAIWTKSIDACSAIGPLAGWVVSGHFIALQDKVDDDYADWRPWLVKQQARREEWLQAWLAQDPLHTRELADRCVHLLQAFDWLSLWLCCRAPIIESPPHQALKLEDEALGDGPFCFSPDVCRPANTEPPLMTVDPWPFSEDNLLVAIETQVVPAVGYRSWKEVLEKAKGRPNGWSLHASRRD